MSAIDISDNEEDIWNYKSSASRPLKRKEGSGNKKSSKKTSNNITTDTVPSSTNEQTCVVIDVDLEEDFPFTNLKPVVKNELSTKQWASMFLTRKEKDSSGSEKNEEKNAKSQKRRKVIPSRSPLKTKTNTERKSIDSERSKSKNKNQESCFNSADIAKKYFSPTKTDPHMQIISSCDEDDSILKFCDNKNLLTGGEMDSSTFTSTSISILDRKEDNFSFDNITTKEHSDLASVDEFCDKTVPEVVDVILIDDESDFAISSNNKTYSVDASSIIDNDMSKSDQDSEMACGFVREVWNSHSSEMPPENSSYKSTKSGGFLKDDCNSNSSSDLSFSGILQENSNDKNMDAGGFVKDSEDSRSSSLDALSETPQENSVDKCTDSSTNCSSLSSIPSMPLSTAARKQISLLSFFPSKTTASTSKPKSHNINYSVTKNSPNPSLTKGVTFPPAKISTGRSSSSPKPTNSSDQLFANKQGRGKQRYCPFYKRIPDTKITVDAFRYGEIPNCDTYFLTHFHYDHYGGLTKKFAQHIFCSHVTGNLVEKRLGVDSRWIHRLPMWRPVQVNGVTMTLMEANHCPGAVIMLFETANGKKILHTGDFRASQEMEAYPALQNVVIDELYLDTTYCNPSYAFPSQKTVIDFSVSLVEKQMALNPKTLIVCGAYTIGKERIFSAIAKALDSKICVMSDKKKVLDCLDDEDLKKRLTLSWSEGQVHVLPMAKLKQEPLFEHHARHSGYTSILAFEPTGWTHSNKAISLDSLQPKWSKNGVTLYGVPYSEHSSYLELKRFVQFIRPKKILPTVNNGNPEARRKMENTFHEWLSE